MNTVTQLKLLGVTPIDVPYYGVVLCAPGRTSSNNYCAFCFNGRVYYSKEHYPKAAWEDWLANRGHIVQDTQTMMTFIQSGKMNADSTTFLRRTHDQVTTLPVLWRRI